MSWHYSNRQSYHVIRAPCYSYWDLTISPDDTVNGFIRDPTRPSKVSRGESAY